MAGAELVQAWFAAGPAASGSRCGSLRSRRRLGYGPRRHIAGPCRSRRLSDVARAPRPGREPVGCAEHVDTMILLRSLGLATTTASGLDAITPNQLRDLQMALASSRHG